MSLRDSIQNATAGVVPQLLGDLAGSTVTTTRYTGTRDAAGRSSSAKTNPIVDAQWFITEITNAQTQRGWGMQSAAVAEAMIPLDSDIADNDVVRITAGDFSGEVYEVEQYRRDPLGNLMTVALRPTGKSGL